MPDTIQETTAAAGPARPGWSVRSHLALYAAALVSPLLVFVGLLLWQYATAERLRLEADTADTAEAVAFALDRDIAGLFGSLDALSSSAYLQTGDLAAFYDQAAELGRRQGIIPVLADAEGQLLVNIRVPFGTPLAKGTLPKPPQSNRPEEPYVTDLFEGAVSKRAVYAVARSIQRGGRPAYVLNFSLEVDRLARILKEADIPPGSYVAIVDRNGVIMARNVRPDDFVGKPASEAFRKAATGNLGTWSSTSASGEPVFGSYRRSAATGFRVAVGMRVADLNAPLWRSLSLFAGLGAIAAALSAVLGFAFAQRVAAPLQALAGRAALLGQGAVVPPLETGLAEANQVARELSAASDSLRSREADLREANEELQRFAYIVSHDLRSPLVNIMGFTTELEVLREDLFRRLDSLRPPGGGELRERQADQRLAEDFDEAVGFIKSSIGRMDRLINAILALSREGRRPLRAERIDMDALAAGIRANAKHQADAADATIEVSPLPAVTSDRLALEQIFANLVDNALKYLRRGVPGRVEISGRRTADGLCYTVRDNGRGIEARDLERIFDLFRRSGVQDRPGEGIGLAHVRALVRRLGGTISLTSEPGQGSTFTVTLPARWVGETTRKAA